MLRSFLRRTLRTLSHRLPQLRRFHGRLGLGRWLAAGSARERIHIDGDIALELDLSSAWFRGLYYTLDPNAMEETFLLRRFLQPTDTFVDVGAHIGYFTLLGAKYAGRVLAFEPSAETFQHLQRNLEINPRWRNKITCYPMGLSDQAGALPLYRSAQEPGAASLRRPAYTDLTVETVPLDTLDHMLAGAPCAFIKIDVEGAEVEALTGARETLHRHRPIVLAELNARAQRDFGRTCQAVVDVIAPLNYTTYAVTMEAGRLRLPPLAVETFTDQTIINALFLPAERAAALLAQLTP